MIAVICYTSSKPKHVTYFTQHALILQCEIPSREFEVKMEGANFYETLHKKDLDCANSGDLSTILGPNNKSFWGFSPLDSTQGFQSDLLAGSLKNTFPPAYFQMLASLQYSWSLITLNRRLRFSRFIVMTKMSPQMKSLKQ